LPEEIYLYKESGFSLMNLNLVAATCI